MDRPSVKNNKNDLIYNNYDEFSSSSSGYFNASYKKARVDNSGRQYNYFEELKTEYDLLVDNCKNELAFQILQNSDFIFNVNKNNKDLIIYNEIIIKNDNQKININIDDVKKLSSKNKVLNGNYQKFILILNEIENKIKSDANHNFDFKIILKFSIEDVTNSIIIMKCESFLQIANEEFSYYKDENILENGLIQGFPFLISQINNYCNED